MSATDEATTEDRHIALQLWYERNGEALCVWFEKMTTQKKIECVRKASPDIPIQLAAIRECAGEKLSATDVLLPELTIDGLCGEEHSLPDKEHKEHSLGMFFNRRCQQADRCYFFDIQLLNAMFARGSLPLFSNGALDNLDTPFVDPADEGENVKALTTDTTQESRAGVLAHLITGRLVHADVYLSLRVRRASLISFMCSIVTLFERDNIGLISPVFEGYLKSELDQQRVTLEMSKEEGEEEEEGTV